MCIAATSAPASAQLVNSGEADTVEPPAQSAAPLNDAIIVTGTRISGFDAPTPVTVVGAADLQEKAINNLSQLLVEVPVFVANQNTGRTSQPVGASNLDLRALGSSRTLLLVDGRRFAATDPTGGVDINIIPTALIKRLEIVTGGASAAYGSDAVAGVVNVTLDDRFQGIKGEVQYGISTYGDIAQPSGSLTAGQAFADGRLHLVASVDIFDSAGQLNQNRRPWGRDDWARLTNPAFPAPGEPRQLFSPNARFSQMTAGGVTALNSHPALQGIQFGPGGTVLPFNYGTNIGTTYMTGGDGSSLAYTQNILPKISRKSAFGRASFDISDDFTVYADALYSRADIFSNGTIPTDRGSLTITRENAFLPSEIAQILDDNGLSSFRIGRVSFEEGESVQEIDNEVQRYGIGAKGSFGSDWNWDVFAQFSINDYYREDRNNRNKARFAYGVDSVMVGGVPTCRVTRDNPGSTDPDIATCVPINLFGAGSITPQALDYFRGSAFADSQNGTAWIRSRQRQNVYAVNLEGTPLDLWAGPVSIAVGAEYREEKITADSDSMSEQRAWLATNPQGLNGSVNVKEAYIETVVPLLQDSALGELLEINGALRITDYSTSGSITTYKLGANYAPASFLRLRGTYSRDIRAPNINELFSGNRQVLTTITNPVTNVALSALQFTGGNPNLQPERAETFTLGAVFTPDFAPRFRLSGDFYSIKINDAIVSLTGQNVVDGCLIRNQTNLCDAITYGSDGNISSVSASLLNAAAVETSGFDVELGYTVPLGAGSLDFRVLATYVDSYETTLNGVTTDTVGNVGSSPYYPPNWRANLSVRYTSEKFSLGTFFRYIGSGKYNTSYEEGVDIADNSISAFTYVNVDASVRPTENFELFARVNNLFNIDPPLTTNPITAPNYAASPYYDTIGRYFKVGARFKF